MAENKEDVIKDETASSFDKEKQNKLLRLLGGKKAGNTKAASAWVNKSRSAAEEDNLKQGLETQFNASLNHRLSGKARRRVGIGFEQDETASEDQTNQLPTNDSNSKPHHDSDKEEPRNRDRSRSPIRKKKDSSDDCDRSNDKSIASNTNKNTSSVNRDKKSFYMQFTKAKD